MGYVVFGHWLPKAGRENELIEAFQHVLAQARSNAEDFPVFFLFKEDKEAKEVEVRSVICFKDEAIYRSYLESSLFRDLKETCEEKSLLRGPQRDEIVDLAGGYLYRPDQVETTSDPVVVIASIQYEPGTRDEGLTKWGITGKAVKKNEQDTFTYCFFKNTEDESKIYTFERYKTKDYLWEVHVPSDAIQQNIARQKDIRTQGGLVHSFWKEVGNSRSTA